jgi:hypothetical protein
MKAKQKSTRRDQGVALVTTVIVVAVLAVVAAAMMQSTTVDRLSSRSALNYAQAKFAAESAFAVAEGQLLANTTNDNFIVVANGFPSFRTNGSAVTVSNGQLFVGNGSVGSSDTSYVPLFSSVNSLTSSVAPILTNAMPRLTLSNPSSTNPPITAVFTNQMPGGFAAASPVVAWVYLTQNVTNASNQVSVVTNARFAYWVEDLGGKLDLSVIGTNTTDPVARRPTGTNPAEIAFWATLTNVAASGESRQAGDPVIVARSNMVSPATARLVASNVATNAALMAELAANLRHDTNEPEMIPFGFGYPDAGRLKTNLSSVDFTQLRAHLARNLPDFGQRGGGNTAASYLDNLAANIIDFADADFSPTGGAGYRGVEPVPFLNERMTRLVAQGPPLLEDGKYNLRIVTTEYFEFWNLHNRTSPATAVTFSYRNRQPLQWFGGSTNFSIDTNVVINIPAMPPGSYFVTNAPAITNVFSFASAFPPTAGANICTLRGNTKTVEYTLSSSGVVYDVGSGAHYSDKNLRGTDLTYFSPSYPGLGSKRNIAGVSDADFNNSMGDPRATFYMTNANGPLPQIQPSWTNGNTSFGGRTLQAGMGTARLTKEARMESWGDGGHSGVAGARGAGLNPPSSGLFVTNEAAFAPASANPKTNGGLERVTDLFGVFDPLQWGQANQSSNWPTEPGAWTNITSGASPNTAYAGGHTLRIGRPEFSRFNTNGLRASQLLDVLSASVATNTNSGALLNRTHGRINVNTAGTNALRALAAGVFHNNDSRLASGSGSGTNFVIPIGAVAGFVEGVRSTRSSRPFLSASQLSQIATNTNPASWPGSAVFGNRSLAGITAGNDAASEEWFAKVYPLTTVRSRNFLIHTIGQSLRTNDLGVLSSHSAMYQVYAEPLRDTNGLTTNSRLRVIQTWGL